MNAKEIIEKLLYTDSTLTNAIKEIESNFISKEEHEKEINKIIAPDNFISKKKVEDAFKKVKFVCFCFCFEDTKEMYKCINCKALQELRKSLGLDMVPKENKIYGTKDLEGEK